ncbi:MAG: hypothetical protein WCO52_01945 [bacterium]
MLKAIGIILVVMGLTGLVLAMVLRSTSPVAFLLALLLTVEAAILFLALLCLGDINSKSFHAKASFHSRQVIVTMLPHCIANDGKALVTYIVRITAEKAHGAKPVVLHEGYYYASKVLCRIRLQEDHFDPMLRLLEKGSFPRLDPLT